MQIRHLSKVRQVNYVQFVVKQEGDCDNSIKLRSVSPLLMLLFAALGVKTGCTVSCIEEILSKNQATR